MKKAVWIALATVLTLPSVQASSTRCYKTPNGTWICPRHHGEASSERDAFSSALAAIGIRVR